MRDEARRLSANELAAIEARAEALVAAEARHRDARRVFQAEDYVHVSSDIYQAAEASAADVPALLAHLQALEAENAAAIAGGISRRISWKNAPPRRGRGW